ncbi:MAG: hypothetical protein ACSLE1_12335 [Sphingobium sp.]
MNDAASFYRRRVQHCRAMAEAADDPRIRHVHEAIIAMYEHRLAVLEYEHAARIEAFATLQH